MCYSIRLNECKWFRYSLKQPNTDINKQVLEYRIKWKREQRENSEKKYGPKLWQEWMGMDKKHISNQ